jgi:hypothetical protein
MHAIIATNGLEQFKLPTMIHSNYRHTELYSGTHARACAFTHACEMSEENEKLCVLSAVAKKVIIIVLWSAHKQASTLTHHE